MEQDREVITVLGHKSLCGEARRHDGLCEMKPHARGGPPKHHEKNSEHPDTRRVAMVATHQNAKGGGGEHKAPLFTTLLWKSFDSWKWTKGSWAAEDFEGENNKVEAVGPATRAAFWEVRGKGSSGEPAIRARLAFARQRRGT